MASADGASDAANIQAANADTETASSATANAPNTIAIAAEDSWDTDSALGSDAQITTQSLTSSILQYRHENGRRYHTYHEGEYWGPNDERAADHLDIGHHLYTVAVDGRLFLAPLGRNVKRALDVGCGTGIWAIDLADQYPECEVIGVDLSPIQPSFVPINLRFEIDDMSSSPWTYPRDHFSFIHVRGLYGCIRDWSAFYRDVYASLEPGGWFEQAEISVAPVSDDGSVTQDHIFKRWGDISLDAGEKFGKTLLIHGQARELLESAQDKWENVKEHVFKLPIGPWPKDKKLKTVGAINQVYWEEGIEGWCLALLTRVLGWSYDEVQLYLMEMRNGLRDRSTHAYHLFNIVFAQKPVSPPLA